MAKDKGGHGSDPRGNAIASAQAAANRAGKPMSVLNLNTVGRAMHVVRDYSPGHEQGPYAHQFVAKVEPQLSGGGQPVVSDAHAAATLAGGPKSAPVDTHPAMADATGLSGRNWGSPRDAASYHIAGSSRVANARYDRENPGPYEGPRKGRWPKDVMKD
jgi:hypothetical protein